GTMSLEGPHILRCDMKRLMKQEALQCVRFACRKFKTSKAMAMYIKNRFDKVYGSNWNCIVGKDFGSHVTFCRLTFFHATYGERAVLLFQTY
ncbi:hypothetical protein LOTGIDRAFT_142181, partial [Lottia gigantea]